MEKKRNTSDFLTREKRWNQPPVTAGEALRQLKRSVPLTASGQARLEKAEREEAESKRKKSMPATKKPRRISPGLRF